jgi:hydroxylamine reductase (hybrid-cluster protein)
MGAFMVAVTFDTLKFAKRLKESGFSEAQAETITEMQQETAAATLEQARHDYHLDELASKRDLKELEFSLKKEIELLRADTKKDIAESKAELIRWVVGVGILQFALISALLLKMAQQV